MKLEVSLIASSNRPQLYESCLMSLRETSVDYEVVFAGNNNFKDMGCKEDSGMIYQKPLFIRPDNFCSQFYYHRTANIKPAQCYEIARRKAVGEVIVWVADDCEFPKDIIGKAYKFWKRHNDQSLILSIQTKESGYGLPEGKLFDMDNHRFFGYRKNSPLMAPLAMMSRKFLEYLGGFDRRYVCGQYENDVVMRAYAEGGSVKIFGGKEEFIDIDHLGKSMQIGESKTEADFLDRPFATGYGKDREVLENSWALNSSRVLEERRDEFEPYSEEELFTKSQSNKGKWE